jgi:adenosylhomocysteine nucleosidase
MHLVVKKNIVIGVKMFGKKDILIVCALEIETQGKLDNYFDDERQILYTGVGKVNASLKLTQRLHSSHLHYLPPMPKLVINYGTAGSRELPIGELVDCTKFTQRDMDVTGMGFIKGQTPFENLTPMILDYDHVEFNPIGKKLRCGTGDNFVQTDMDTYSDVFDMEAYALAKVCHHYDVPFISFKYITDNANEHSAGDWVDNCSDGVREFKNKILKEL